MPLVSKAVPFNALLKDRLVQTSFRFCKSVDGPFTHFRDEGVGIAVPVRIGGLDFGIYPTELKNPATSQVKTIIDLQI